MLEAVHYQMEIQDAIQKKGNQSSADGWWPKAGYYWSSAIEADGQHVLRTIRGQLTSLL